MKGCTCSTAYDTVKCNTQRGFVVPQMSHNKCSIYPQCIMWMDKTGVYSIVNCKKKCVFESVTSNRSVLVNSLLFSALSQ